MSKSDTGKADPGKTGRHRDAWRLGNRGTTAIEFALIAPALFLMLFGCMEYGRLIWTEGALNYAVQEAARCASVTPSTCGTASQISTYAANRISANNIPATAFTATTATCGHQVNASFVFPFVLINLFTSSVTLTAMACLP